jgi:bifunctional UDP-N-acetylglucosamine pyrophosphorylase/glucosamine-1-phosphate N-acetyltransferase
MRDLTTIILAAGEGKRMRSRRPKVLHRLCGRPLVAYSVRIARLLSDRIVLVVGPDGSAQVRAALGGDTSDIVMVEQRERLGTGHAVLQAQPECGAGTVLVLPGDVPLLSGQTIDCLLYTI